MLDLYPEIEHHFIGGIYLKKMQLDAGNYIHTHKHNFDHATILACGIARISIGTITRTYEGPTVLNVPANYSHMIEAVTDTIWYCVHSTDVTNADEIDETLVVSETGD